MRRVLAQARKDLTQMIRDRLALALALVMPIILIALLGTSTSLTVTDIPIVIQDLDQTPPSRQYADAFRSSLTFRVVSLPTDMSPERALALGRARAALVIPEHFARDVRRERSAQTQLIVDATDTNTALLTRGGASQITRAFARDVLRGRNAEAQLLVDATDTNTALITKGNAAQVTSAFAGGLAAKPAGVSAPKVVRGGIGSVKVSTRLWFNPGREPRKFYGPGMFVLALSIFPTVLAALAMSREGEQQTILQVYVSSISAPEFLLGKILCGMVVGFAEWLLAMALLFTLFGLRFAGDSTPMLVGSLLYLFCAVAFGSLVGAAIPNQAAAVQAVALGGFLLGFLLSGLIFPVENIPAGLRWISNFIWGRYYIEIVRDALLQGGGWPAVWLKVVVIAVIGGIFYTMAWRGMRRMQLEA